MLAPCGRTGDGLAVVSQNFKQLVRGVDHTTLALTALSFPDTPDVLMTWLVRGFTILTEDGKHHVKHGFIYVPRSVNIADVEFAALGVEGDEPDSMTSESTPKPMLVPVLETPASPPPCCDRPHLRMKLARSSQATTHTVPAFARVHAFDTVSRCLLNPC
jgi:hypothetical protein